MYTLLESLDLDAGFFIDRIALAKQGDNRIGSVRPSVCLSVRPSVCQSTLSRLNRLTFDLIFCMGVDLG